LGSRREVAEPCPERRVDGNASSELIEARSSVERIEKWKSSLSFQSLEQNRCLFESKV